MRYFKVIDDYPCAILLEGDLVETEDSALKTALEFYISRNGEDIDHFQEVCLENFPNLFEEISHGQYIEEKTRISLSRKELYDFMASHKK